MQHRILAAAAALVLSSGCAWAEDGAYTEAQAARGKPLYTEKCASCHGVELGGGPGVPALTGPEFSFGWNNKTVGELYTYVKTNMPPAMSGDLTDQQHADLVAVILKTNAQPAGKAELKPDAPGLAATLKLN